MASEQWGRGETCRDLIEDRDWLKTLAFARRRRSATRTSRSRGALLHGRGLGQALRRPRARRGDRRPPGRNGAARASRAARERKGGGGGGGGGDTLASPLQGNVFKVLVEQGAEVEEGALICIIEAMKMENEITAHKAGKVAELPISEGAAVSVGATLAVITTPTEGANRPRDDLGVVWTLKSSRERWTSGSPCSRMPTTGSSTAPRLYAVGASRTQIGTRVRAGRLIPLHRGVYAVGHRRLTQRGRWLPRSARSGRARC